MSLLEVHVEAYHMKLCVAVVARRELVQTVSLELDCSHLSVEAQLSEVVMVERSDYKFASQQTDELMDPECLEH
jgi:hypothetical protein